MGVLGARLEGGGRRRARARPLSTAQERKRVERRQRQWSLHPVWHKNRLKMSLLRYFFRVRAAHHWCVRRRRLTAGWPGPFSPLARQSGGPATLVAPELNALPAPLAPLLPPPPAAVLYGDVFAEAIHLRNVVRYHIKERLQRGLRLGPRRVSAVGTVKLSCVRAAAMQLFPFLLENVRPLVTRVTLKGADALTKLDAALGPRWNRLEKKDGTLYSVATTVYTAGVPKLYDVSFSLRKRAIEDYERLSTGADGTPVERVVRETVVCFLTIKFSIVRTVLPV